MVRNTLTIVGAVVATGCICLIVTWSMQSRTGVAVVDLDEVAKRLGKQAEMQMSIHEQTVLTQQKLTQIGKNAVAQLEDARRALGETPTQEETNKFRKMQQSASLQLNQLKQQAQQELGGHRQRLVTEFREQTRPVVAKVAKEHGFATVMTRNDAFLFSYEDAVDITDEVVDLMASTMKAAPARAPASKPAPAPATKAVSQKSKETRSAAKPRVQQVKHEAPEKK